MNSGDGKGMPLTDLRLQIDRHQRLERQVRLDPGDDLDKVADGARDREIRTTSPRTPSMKRKDREKGN